MQLGKQYAQSHVMIWYLQNEKHIFFWKIKKMKWKSSDLMFMWGRSELN